MYELRILLVSSPEEDKSDKNHWNTQKQQQQKIEQNPEILQCRFMCTVFTLPEFLFIKCKL